MQDISCEHFRKRRSTLEPASHEQAAEAQGRNSISYLSLEMLQSMTVFLLVLTMMKGRWMMELAGGGLFACCSPCLFRWTRFLKAICCGRAGGRGDGKRREEIKFERLLLQKQLNENTALPRCPGIRHPAGTSKGTIALGCCAGRHFFFCVSAV